jgi:hypothetical protein
MTSETDVYEDRLGNQFVYLDRHPDFLLNVRSGIRFVRKQPLQQLPGGKEGFTAPHVIATCVWGEVALLAGPMFDEATKP